MSPGQAHFERMKAEGFNDLSAFLEAFDYEKKLGRDPVMVIEGTHSELDEFILGMDEHRIARVRAAWKFTD